MTYSIVARDAVTGELGVAAQSCAFALGVAVTWARAGVGAVCTQGLTEPGYGPRCLDLMADGVSAEEALQRTRSADARSDYRQVGVVDAEGRAASFTGANSIDLTCHTQGDGYSVQANVMARPGVCSAMATAFESTTGALSARLLAALAAAQERGGDARGQMSAAMRVVNGSRSDLPWEGVVVDLRVDHHSRPVLELSRLVRIAQARDHDSVAFELLAADDAAGALAAVDRALDLVPDEVDLVVSRIVALVGLGRWEEAVDHLRRVLSAQPGWAGVLRASAGSGLLPQLDSATIEALIAQSRP